MEKNEAMNMAKIALLHEMDAESPPIDVSKPQSSGYTQVDGEPGTTLPLRDGVPQRVALALPAQSALETHLPASL